MKSRRSFKAALVTGAAKRLGKAIALHLATQGYNIALHYHRSKAEAMKAAQDIHRLGVGCELFACDLANSTEASGLCVKVFQSFPGLSILVNNASVFIPNRFGIHDMGLFDRHWNVNFKAPYILSCAFERQVQNGQIINLIDTHVSKYVTQHADYLLTKKTLAEFTKMSAAQWGPRIRVNGISPGIILPVVNSQNDDRSRRAKGIPLKRVGHPKYILHALQFFLENDYITGHIMNVDGGEGLV